MGRRRVKREQIVEGARKAFLVGGYDGTSTDEVASSADVSKATVYSHFRSKQEIFLAVLEAECERQVDAAVDILCDTDGAEEILIQLACNVITLLTTPHVLDMYRVAVSGSRRFPEFGRTFYFAGPELGMRSLSRCLDRLRHRDLLAFDDAEVAARQFGQLCKSDQFYRTLFLIEKSISANEVQEQAREVAKTFFRAFGQQKRRLQRHQ